ncbi:putative dynamin-like GTPase Dnm1 [Alternaria alternata]|nr:putative dynamin-like GTPase Dnm1 [Alternaria alternata]
MCAPAREENAVSAEQILQSSVEADANSANSIRSLWDHNLPESHQCSRTSSARTSFPVAVVSSHAGRSFSNSSTSQANATKTTMTKSTYPTHPQV